MIRDIQSFSINSRLASSYDPLDVLAIVNPEIASIAYANKEKILTPELMPYICGIREIQSRENISLLNNITERLRIGSDERQNQVINDTKLGIVRVLDGGHTVRTSIEQTEETKRTGLMSSASVDMTRLKCDANIEMIRIHTNGQIHLSDNELKQIYIQATTYRDIALATQERISTVERLKCEATREINYMQVEGAKYVSDNNLKARSRESRELTTRHNNTIAGEIEKQSLLVQSDKIKANARIMEADYQSRSKYHEVMVDCFARLGKARELTLREDKKVEGELIKTYLSTQYQFFKANLELQIRKEDLEVRDQEAIQKRDTEIAKSLLDKLPIKEYKSIELNLPTGTYRLDTK